MCEALVLFGHEDEAYDLQAALSDLIRCQLEAARDVAEHPPPLTQQQQQLLSPQWAVELKGRVERIEAAMKGVHWKWDVLRGSEA